MFLPQNPPSQKGDIVINPETGDLVVHTGKEYVAVCTNEIDRAEAENRKYHSGDVKEPLRSRLLGLGYLEQDGDELKVVTPITSQHAKELILEHTSDPIDSARYLKDLAQLNMVVGLPTISNAQILKRDTTLSAIKNRLTSNSGGYIPFLSNQIT